MKNNILILKQLFNRKSDRGFTLIELLLALVMSAAVIGAAGMGLVVMMQGNEDSLNKSERKVELNRALDFMAEEIRMAEEIETDPTSIPGFVAADDTSDVTEVLALKIPVEDDPTSPDGDDTNNWINVVYYVASPPSDSPWQGDRVIYRWGPDIDLSTTGASDPNGLYDDDAVDADSSVNQNKMFIDNINISAAPTCPTDTPNDFGADGFYACVDNNRRRVDLYLSGKLDPDASNSETIDVTTRVFTRN